MKFPVYGVLCLIASGVAMAVGFLSALSLTHISNFNEGMPFVTNFGVYFLLSFYLADKAQKAIKSTEAESDKTKKTDE
ncbi:MAG: hypothetical protein AAB568_02700 [Patescibacteria group bacterium]